MNEETPKDPREALLPFITAAKVQAFKAAYAPSDDELDQDTITLKDADLRKFFNAYIKTVGDPLSIYIDDYLVPAGYSMTVSMLGEPVILVKQR